MRKYDKPDFDVKEIVLACANSIRDTEKKERIEKASEYIAKKSNEYDSLAESHHLFQLDKHNMVDGLVSADEMKQLYDDKFVNHKSVRSKYYDKIMILTNGVCPVCELGQVGNLDHYMPKSLYPTYALTPYNLIPICRDCNFKKKNDTFSSYEKAPIHPYYDETDDEIWLKAELNIVENGLVASYFVNQENIDDAFAKKCISHMIIFDLYNKYAIEAAREISENMLMWRKGINRWGEDGIKDFINDIIESLECTQKNSWKVALYRALLENVNILYGVN